MICDALALVGANKAVLNLQNEAAIRELRNNVNRQNNCLNANLNKTVNASVKQLNAINCIGCGLCSYICPSRIDLTFLTVKAKEFLIRGNNDK